MNLIAGRDAAAGTDDSHDQCFDMAVVFGCFKLLLHPLAHFTINHAFDIDHGDFV